MTQQYDNTNTGLIGKNDRKEKPNHPDIRGTANIDGTEYWVDGWRKERKDGSGSFYSLAFKRKEEMRPTREQPKNKPLPTMVEQDEDIPF